MADSARVLVVDDNAINRLLAKAMLGKLGWLVDEADSGDAALKQAAANNYALVLLDISMPGLSGEDTCATLRRNHQTGMRIIAYTAHAFPEERARFLAAGFDDILVKPISRQRLEETVGSA